MFIQRAVATLAGSPCTIDDLVFIETRSKYWKVVEIHEGRTGAVWCFIRKDDGAVLMPARWSSPAKNARSYVTHDDYGMSGVTDGRVKYMSELTDMREREGEGELMTFTEARTGCAEHLSPAEELKSLREKYDPHNKYPGWTMLQILAHVTIPKPRDKRTAW